MELDFGLPGPAPWNIIVHWPATGLLWTLNSLCVASGSMFWHDESPRQSYAWQSLVFGSLLCSGMSEGTISLAASMP